MRKTLLLLISLLIILPLAGAWGLVIPGRENLLERFTDAALMNGYIYAVGIEVEGYYDDVIFTPWKGNVTLFKLTSEGIPLERYTIGTFCDEDLLFSYQIENLNGSVVLGGTSCTPRFRNITAWVLALDKDGNYLWGFSLPGVLTGLTVWNNSVFTAIIQRNCSHIIEAKNGSVLKAYLLENYTIGFLNAYDKNLLLAGFTGEGKTWAGILHENGSMTVWETNITKGEESLVGIVQTEVGPILTAGGKGGAYILNIGSRAGIFIKGLYPTSFVKIGDIPTLVGVYNNGSLIVEIGTNGTPENATLLRNVLATFAAKELVGGSMKGDYYLYPLQGGDEKTVITFIPVNFSVASKTVTLKPESENVTEFHPSVHVTDYRAHLTLITQPLNASVYINGTYAGSTSLNMTLDPGTYVIRITKEGYEDYTAKMTLELGEDYTMSAKLVPLIGYITINSTPLGADVYVDGKLAGKTPLVGYKLSPGEHEVEVRLRDYEAYRTTVAVGATESVEINAQLMPLPGRLFISSTPANLTATVTGENLSKNCTAPCSLSLPPGKYTINVTNGEEWNSTKVAIKPNATMNVTLKIPIEESKSLGLPLAFAVFLALAGSGAYLYYSRGQRREEAEVEVMKGDSFIEVKADNAYGVSHVGNRENNEDNLLILKLPDAYLLAVADGLGGHNAGEVASQIAVDTLKEVFEREYTKGMSEGEVKTLLRKAHELAHRRIKENAVGEREGMGTTLVTAFIRNGKAIIANTGDSRAYLIRSGKIVTKTKDHSLVQEMLDRGEITEEEAKRHPLRNIITKALGIDFGIDIYEWKLEEGDVLLLSSDGLHDYVEEGRIVEIASTGKTPEAIAKKLIEEALPVTKDNVTVVVWKE